MNRTDVSPLLTVTVLAVSSLTVMANATIAPSLPGLAAAFADTPGIEALAGLVLSLPSLAVILTAALFGALADRTNRRLLLGAALTIYAIGGASALLATTMPQILAGRVALGIGVAGTMTVATMLAGELWQGPARARFMGWQAAAMSAGGIVFLLAGGALAELDWRGPFLLYLAALPLAAMALITIPSRAAPTPTPASGAENFPWARFLMIGGIAFFGMIMFYVVPTRLPFLLAEIGITAPSAAGIAIAALTAASIPGSLRYGWVRARLNPVAVFALSFGLMAAGYTVISVAAAFPVVVTGTVLAGLGLGMVLPNQMNWVMADMPEAARGRAAGLLTTAVFAGQFASPLVSGLLARWLSPAEVFAAFAAILASAAVALALQSHRRTLAAA